METLVRRKMKTKKKSVKVDEAQASARSCAGRPDFLPCATHGHGKCCKLHWCCHLGWCHCKYVYQPMTNVLQLPSTPVPSGPGDHAPSLSLSALLDKRFLRTTSCLASPSSELCLRVGATDPSMEDYTVTRVKGRAFYIPSGRRSQTSCASPISVLSNQTAGTPAHLQALDHRGSVGPESPHGPSPSGTREDSGTPGADRTGEDLELNREPGGEQLGQVLNEDVTEEFNEGRRDRSPRPVSGTPRELAEGLETTV